MFETKHLNAIRDSLKENIPLIIKEKISKLEKEYRKNPYIRDANVSFDGKETVSVTLSLTFQLKDDLQNIPAIFEYGGVVFDSTNRMIEIKPGYYMRRIFADGNTK